MTPRGLFVERGTQVCQISWPCRRWSRDFAQQSIPAPLQALSFQSGASLGYGFATKSLDDDTEDEEDLEHDYAMLDAAAGAA